MEYDGLRYIKIYSTGASASSLGIPLPRWGVDCICAIFYNIGSRMDPNLKQRIIEGQRNNLRDFIFKHII